MVTRLQRTLDDFNEEVQEIVGDLKDSSDRRNQIIHDLMEGKEASQSEKVSTPDSGDTSGPDSSEMSEWERPFPFTHFGRIRSRSITTIWCRNFF